MTKAEPETRILNKTVRRMAEIGTTSWGVFCVLEMHANQHRAAWPSIETLATLTGLSQNSVRKSLKRLEDAGWIRKQESRGRKSHQYFVNRTPRVDATTNPSKLEGLNSATAGGKPFNCENSNPSKSAFSNPSKIEAELTPFEPTPKELTPPNNSTTPVFSVSQSARGSKTEQTEVVKFELEEIDPIAASLAKNSGCYPDEEIVWQAAGFVHVGILSRNDVELAAELTCKFADKPAEYFRDLITEKLEACGWSYSQALRRCKPSAYWPKHGCASESTQKRDVREQNVREHREQNVRAQLVGMLHGIGKGRIPA